MMLIDTSAWIPFLRRKGEKSIKERVASYLELDQAAYTGPIYFELLCGAGNRKEEDLVHDVLRLCTCIDFSEDEWIRSAGIERRLRERGLKVPRDDIFIAAAALRAQVPLLCKDTHFDLIRDHADADLMVEQMGPNAEH